MVERKKKNRRKSRLILIEEIRLAHLFAVFLSSSSQRHTVFGLPWQISWEIMNVSYFADNQFIFGIN